MNFRRIWAGIPALFAAGLCSAAFAGNPKVWTDPVGDAVWRRTDPQMIGEIPTGSTKPDLVKLSIGAWQTSSGVSDPYTGFYADPSSANLFRIDLEIKGLVCPPGPASPSNYNPRQFGPNPLYGFIELDIDGDQDSGGELGSAAKSKYLANVGRFGRSPRGSIHSRFATGGRDLDGTFGTDPQYERSGADFLLAFCGCYATTIYNEGGDGNHVFDKGETWIVRGGFFQRAGGFQSVCASVGGAAGLQAGLYVPLVNLRWSHSVATNITTITLVYALTPAGAGQLAGQPPQAVNLNVSDQTCIVEALSDLIDGAHFASFHSPVWYLSNHWQGRSPTDRNWLDPTRWDATALIGTAYQDPVDGAVFAWSDTGFGECPLDLDGDGVAGPMDRQIVRDRIDAMDGTGLDAEGQAQENGGARLIDPGVNFECADVDGDGAVGRLDIAAYCPADFNLDGVINILDFLTFMNAFAAGDLRADFNHNGALETTDFNAFMNAIAAGC